MFFRNVLIYFSWTRRKQFSPRSPMSLRQTAICFWVRRTTLNLSEAFDRVNLGKTVCYRLRGK